MLDNGESIEKIAEDVGCKRRAIIRVQTSVARYGSTAAPANRSGPDRKITPVMCEALCRRLAEKPDMVRREMIAFIREEFDIDVSTASITRTLQAIQYTRKNTRRIARQRNPELRHYYQYRLKSEGLRSYQLIFIDESGMDKTVGLRRKGWAPKGVTPRQTAPFQREERY